MLQEIRSLSVKNYKGVNGEITLHPEGKSLVVIAGANGSGKSSFIDAVAEIFDPKGTRITSRPIHDGAEEAEATLTTDSARLVRTWKKNDAGTLNAYALDGAKYPSGKEFVLKATGGAIFDASEFVNMDAKQQRAELLARVELPFDLAEIDAKRKGYFDGRTDVTRDVGKLRAQLAGFPPADDTVPAEEVSAAAIIEELDKARAANSEIQRASFQVDELKARTERLDAQIAALQAEREEAITGIADLAKVVERNPINTGEISTRLESVEETNARVREQQQRAAVAAQLDTASALEADLNAKLDAIDKQKADGLKAAKFPVEGLSVDDDGITFNGIPFKQANTAAKTTVAFDLMTQAKPDLRIVVIKDGDTLDAESLAGIGRIATERGYLVLCERDRDESREIGFQISEGQLA